MGNVKTLAMIAIVGVLSGGIANAAVEVKKTRHMARYEFSIDGVDVKDLFEDGLPANSQTIYLRGIDGYVTKAKKVGEPEIPVIRFYVEAKGDIEAVGEFGKASSAFNKVKVSGIIKPAQPPRIKKPGVVQDYVINEEKYDLVKRLPEIDQPLLMIHGDNDDVSPISNARKIHSVVSHALLVENEGNHTFGGSHPWSETKLPPVLQQAAENSFEFIGM